MISVELVLDESLIAFVNDTMQNAPKKMRRKLTAIASRVKIEYVEQRLKRRPGKPTYPLRWKSLAQKRFVRLMLARSNKLPYPRGSSGGGGLLERYTVDFGADDREGTLSISNRAPHARWVVGDNAQPFHLDTGWVQIAPVIAEARPEVERWITDAWLEVAEVDFGGRRNTGAT